MLLAHLGYKFRPMMLGKIHFLVGKLWGRKIGTFYYVLYLAQKHLRLSRLFISAGYFEIWHMKCPKKVDRMKGIFCRAELYSICGNELGRKYEILGTIPNLTNLGQVGLGNGLGQVLVLNICKLHVKQIPAYRLRFFLRHY